MKKILLFVVSVFLMLFHNNASAQGVIDSVITTQYIECPGDEGCLTVYSTGNDYTVVLQKANTMVCRHMYHRKVYHHHQLVIKRKVVCIYGVGWQMILKYLL